MSTHQGAINWTSVKNAGIKFAFTKATEGVDFIDNRFAANMSGARAAGVYIGPYHYARPDSFSTNPSDAANEANDFVDAIAPYYATPGKYLRPVIDMEESDITTSNKKTFISKWIRDFAAVVQARLGVKPIIYASSSYITSYFESNINQFPLWLANWNYTPPTLPPASADGIFNGWRFWQYTSSGNVGGISPVDRDVYQGTLSQLLDEFIVGPTADFNADGAVDGSDFLTWQANDGKAGAAVTFAAGDANFNRSINSGDMSIWKNGFGGEPTAAAAAAPEPATQWLALWLAAVAVRARRALTR